ncbi:hypothetical protein EVG20_g351 [Dentipellis fragilis]|uniref:GYF domain-containing protein n=1 Tax=Dentipellis fragilis TaxID=205917 RepID=A0A4Y9ZFM1_9AGAM|nr:hypothetical protein EVG20_g351 [Dentipellis fragilis]
MPPRPTHKRAAVSEDSGEPGPSKRHASKKTRFVDPSEDPATFAEDVQAALENPSAAKKGRVRIEGYDSDSSDDGEGVVPSRRPGAEGGEEEDDMFAMGDKEEKKAESTKKPKEEFLRLGDIEGQEFGGSGGEESSEEEDEPEDEDDAERRKKVGMGYELSSFNMREEMEEGKFSADGTFVRTFDPHALHDKWMDGLDEKEIKQARKRKRQQERIQKERIKAEENELAALGGKEAVEKKVIEMLKKGETVLEALQRLGVQAKKERSKSKSASQKRQANANGTAMNVDGPKPTSQVQSEIDELTHLASTLMSLGDTDVYSKTYEELVRSVRSAGNVEPSWVPPSADVKYEYKWDVPGSTGQDGEVFGPFDEDNMLVWYKASYFGAGGEKVKVRKVGGEWSSWDDVIS